MLPISSASKAILLTKDEGEKGTATHIANRNDLQLRWAYQRQFVFPRGFCKITDKYIFRIAGVTLGDCLIAK